MKQWFALRSKPKKESLAATQLSKAGIDVYLPEVRVCSEHGKPGALEPFFPGYLFGRLDPVLGEIRLANYTCGILHVVGYGMEPWSVPDDVVIAIREHLMRNRGQAPLPDFRQGECLVVTSGPLKDIEVIFDRRLSPAGRVHVLVKMLERLCRVQLDARQLQRTGARVGMNQGCG